MKKRILIENYSLKALKNLREIAKVTHEYLRDEESIDIDELKEFEEAESPLPIDIFYLTHLYIIYKNEAKKIGVHSFPSLTSDLMYPHPDGIKYQEFIASHPNYDGMPVERNKFGKIKWVTTSQTIQGQKRIDFWEKKRKQFELDAKHVLMPGVRQKVAYLNHPTKKHVCLFSGTELYIDYRYLSPSKIDQINILYELELKYYDYDIFDTCELLYNIDACVGLAKILRIQKKFDTLEKLLNILREDYVDKMYSPYVSPGVMSNSPDRLDGYHSYNNDVREITDTGRYKDNLKKYTQDRRVYEMWSGGNWKMADRLYATFVKNKVSPDHIGPISLGFTHRPKFQPMTVNENSSKGNRMSLEDVNVLLEDEKSGEIVITWHSEFIWDKLKYRVHSDQDAVKLSALMRTNLHHILIVLSMINDIGHRDFLLKYLSPEHSYYDYEFLDFNPQTGTYRKVNVRELNGKNQENNAQRYVRKAFESLNYYSNKVNRKNKIWDSIVVDNMLKILLSELKQENYKSAEEKLYKILEQLAEEAEQKWINL